MAEQMPAAAPRSPLEFIKQHAVFTVEEFRAAYLALDRDARAAHDTLAYHVRSGRIVSVRRGLYARAGWVDPWLLASKIVPDAVISHDGALSFHGLTGAGYRLTYMTTRRLEDFCHGEIVYQPLRVTAARLRSTDAQTFEREHAFVRVSTLEQALVDCLADLDRVPGTGKDLEAPRALPNLDELFDVFSRSADATNLDHLVSLALARKSPLLTSRLGFFLQCSRKRKLDERQVGRLEAHMLPAPAYFLRSARTKHDVLLGRWNLILPPQLRARFD